MSIGKSSIARAVSANTAVKEKTAEHTAVGVSSFSVESIGILNAAKTPDDIESLKQSIEKRGILCPVLVCVTAKGDAWLIDGYRRLYAAKELGITQINAAVITAENKTEVNRIYEELSKTKKAAVSYDIHEEKFRVLAVKDHDLPAYLL